MTRLNGKQLLVLVYVAIVLVSIFRIVVHPLHYTTPDSIAYLKQAEFIKTSWTSSESISDLFQIKGTFTTWPLGYPLSTAATSLLTSSSPLVASKIVNFIFLGFLFILLFKWFEDKAWFVSLVFLSYGSLEVIAETWSELPFVFFAFFLCHLILNEKSFSSWSLALLLTTCLILLFLFRYVGVIYFFILAAYLVKHGIGKNYKLAATYFLALAISSLFVLWYFYENKAISGFYSGMPRLEPAHKTVGSFITEFFQGVFNEFAIARNYFFKGIMDWLFLSLLLAQVVVIALIVKTKALLSSPFILDHKVRVLLISGVSYLIGITAFKIFIPIDAFDFRILFPFTAPTFVGLFAMLTQDHQKEFFKKNAKWIVGFMVLSLIINLPKTYLLESLGII